MHSLPRFITPIGLGGSLGLLSWSLLCEIYWASCRQWRDERTHHLAIPKLYARAGRRLSAIAPRLFSHAPRYALPPWCTGACPKLVHALYGYLTGLLLYAYLGRRMNGIYALLGFSFLSQCRRFCA
jgi:hypothetical protein